MSVGSGPRAIEALVQAGAVESRYVRVGRGRRVVLLVPTLREQWLDSALVRCMAQDHCVVVPELPQVSVLVGSEDEGSAVESWLTAFLDGIGIESCAVIVERSLAPALCRVARGDERIEKLVFIGADVPRGGPDSPLDPPCPALAWPAPLEAGVEAAELLVETLAKFLQRD